ncbi:MAG: hypothetical protein OXN21_03015 [Chloroflexota bacterium]|nr:hypothetical protein [Chloroflexota bacterium]
MRILIIVLALVQFLLAGFTSAVGGFADGGEIWERAVLMGIHPMAAIGLLVMAFVPGLKPAGLQIVRGLLVINIIADLVLAALIYGGVSRGDWWLPLIFSVIPAIGLGYSFGKKAR